MSAPSRVLFVHRSLAFSSATERLRSAAQHLVRQGVAVTVLSGPGARTDELRATGAEVLAGEAEPHGWRGLFAAARIRRLAARLAPDLVHVTSEVLAPLAARLARPYLLELERPVRGRLAWHRSHLRGVILPCRTLEENAVNRGGLPRDRLRVLPHAPTPGPALQVPPFARGEPLRVGCAGYLTPDLGVQVFLEAAWHLAVRGVPARFLVFGEGPDEEALRRRARELAIADRVTITAPAAPGTAEVLAQLDLFVCPRLDGAPGWFAHEALALGLPCVVSAIGGAFGLVEDGRDGLLVERGDPVKLAEAIEGLLADPSRAATLGAAARARRLEEASGTPFGEGLEALYAELGEGAAVA